MSHQRLRAAAVVLLTVGWSAVLIAQNYYWETVTGDAESIVPVAKAFYAPRKLKYVSAREYDPTLIIRLDRGSVFVVNTRRETYAEISFADWKSMREQQSAMVFQIPPDVQNLPEEQRSRRLQELIAAQSNENSKVDVLRIPETKMIRGYMCAKSIMRQDGKTLLTVWSTRAMKEFESMRSDLTEAYHQLSLNYPAMRNLSVALKSIDGFPIEYQRGEEKTTVQKIEKRVWGEEEFEPPSGYKRTTPAVPGR